MIMLHNLFLKKRQAGILLYLLFLLPFQNIGQPIIDASKEGDLEEVKQLISSDPQLTHQRDETEKTPLHWACRGVHEDVAIYLINAGADVNAIDKNQISPLHSIAARGNIRIAELLIENGANVNLQDYEKQTPLHYAGIYGFDQMVVLLIDNGADLEARNSRERTPLILSARERGYINVIQVLVERGADINAKDKYQSTALDLAAWRGFEDVVNYLLDHDAIIEVDDPYFIESVVANGLGRLFNKIITLGADINITTENGGTLLHRAAEGGSVVIIDNLLGEGLDINQQDRFGMTPLHYASEYGQSEAVEFLLSNDAKINSRTLKGETPYNLAKAKDHQDVIDILITHGADTAPPKFPVLRGKYFGQPAPGNIPQLFADDIISTLNGLHAPVVFSPDGTEACWPGMFDDPNSGYDMGKIMYSKVENGKWIYPTFAFFSSDDDDGEPFYSPDGDKLYFISDRPLPWESEESKENIWFMNKTGNGWSEPQPISPVINGMDLHWVFSVNNNEDLYFGSSEGGGYGSNDIYYSKYTDGEYSQPENLGTVINSENPEFSPCISPDGSYLIFTRVEAETRNTDLYISFKNKDGEWSKAKNLGDLVNTGGGELCPIITADGKYLFYLGSRDGINGVYWVSTSFIKDLKEEK